MPADAHARAPGEEGRRRLAERRIERIGREVLGLSSTRRVERLGREVFKLPSAQVQNGVRLLSEDCRDLEIDLLAAHRTSQRVVHELDQMLSRCLLGLPGGLCVRREAIWREGAVAREADAEGLPPLGVTARLAARGQ